MEEESNASIHTKEVTRLWRAWRTIHEMVQDRVRIPSSACRKRLIFHIMRHGADSSRCRATS